VFCLSRLSTSPTYTFSAFFLDGYQKNELIGLCLEELVIQSEDQKLVWARDEMKSSCSTYREIKAGFKKEDDVFLAAPRQGCRNIGTGRLWTFDLSSRHKSLLLPRIFSS
jgi:hypothetical protein